MPCIVLSLLPFFFALPLMAQPISPATPPALRGQQPLTSLCSTTPNPSFCLSTLCSYPSSPPSAALPDLTAFVVSAALAEVDSSYALAEDLVHKDADGSKSSSTLNDCLELMDGCRDGLQGCLRTLTGLNASAPPAHLRQQVMDIRVWLSAALTDLGTCWDELADPGEEALRARLQQAGQVKAEPLLSMAFTMAQTLQRPDGVRAAYDMTCRRLHIHDDAALGPAPAPAPAPLRQ